MRDASCQQCGGVIRGHRKMCFSNGYIPHSHKRMPIAERYRNKCTTPTLVSEHELRTILSTQGLIARSDLLLCHKKTATRLRQQYRCIAIERVGVGNWHWNNTPVIAMHYAYVVFPCSTFNLFHTSDMLTSHHHSLDR